MEFSKKIVIVMGFMSLIMAICAIILVSNKPQPEISCSCIRDYEYIMTVEDGTNDSTLIYTIYDNKHNRIGVVGSNKIDSLIINDNL